MFEELLECHKLSQLSGSWSRQGTGFPIGVLAVHARSASRADGMSVGNAIINLRLQARRHR